jgi:Tfp pilus assembly protein PilF
MIALLVRRHAVAVVVVAVSLLGCNGGPNAEDARVAQAEHDLANDAFRRGRLREALAHAERSLSVDETHADAHYLAAVTLMMFCASDEGSPDCRYHDAEEHLREALAAQPEFRDARNALGVILIHQRRPRAAVGVLEPLTRDILYRSPEKAWGNLGWARLEAGQPAEAVAALKRSVAAQPLFCVGHYRLGLAYEKQRQFAAARQAYSRALAITEGGCDRLQDAFWARARVVERLGLRPEMKKDLKRCRDLTTDTAIGRRCQKKLSAMR